MRCIEMRYLRPTIAFFAVWLAAGTAQAQYTTATIAACPNDGVAGVCVVYSGTNVKTTEPGANRYTPQSSAELSSHTTAKKAQLNGFDTTQKAFVPGTVVPDATVIPPTQTQDDLDVAAFAVLVRAWLVEKAKLSASEPAVGRRRRRGRDCAGLRRLEESGRAHALR